MGERELILILAALIFFSTASLSINRFILNSNESILDTEFDYFAVSLGQRIIEEAKTRRYDLYEPPDDFTSPSGLGPRYNEVYPNYNDVDDYNGFDVTVNTPRNTYRIQVTVYYVDESNIDQKVTYRTNHKKMIVRITSEYMKFPIILSHVFSYMDHY